jgi:hypothetical protein
MMEATSCLTHQGPWNSSTRKIPAFAFIEKYSNKVDSLDFSAPFHDWYSPSCQFHNNNGTTFDGGDAIWTWMRGLFGAFSNVEHNIQVARLIKATTQEISPEREAEWVILEATTAFSMKDPMLAGEPIVILRLLSFLVGKSEFSGQGTDGLQILEAKVWWDTGALARELTKRRGS